MNITLNIGLNVSENYLPEGVAEMALQYEYVEAYLFRALGAPSQIGLAQSTTEKTVVVQYARVESVLYNLYQIAHELQQDCIAYSVQDDDDRPMGGALVGKYAHAWNYGIFNEEYFILQAVGSSPELGLNLELTLN